VGGGERDQEQVPRVRDGAEMEACVFIVNQSTSSFNVRRASAPTLRSLNPHSISAGLPSSGTNAGDTPSSPSSSLSSPPSSTTAPCMLIVEGPFLCMDTCPAAAGNRSVLRLKRLVPPRGVLVHKAALRDAVGELRLGQLAVVLTLGGTLRYRRDPSTGRRRARRRPRRSPRRRRGRWARSRRPTRRWRSARSM